jgi:CRP/FNR family transcriptional regulator, cyclic AMP receptor protein
MDMDMSRRLAISNDCLSCTLRRTSDFCNLPQSLMSEFSALGHLTLYPANATLMVEGECPRGVYIACSGRSKLSVEARDGKTIILKIAGDRQILGLSAVLCGGPSLITVTTIELCQIKFIERDSFLNLIEHNGQAAIACAMLLASEVNTSFDDVYELLLARSSTEKLARLLLSWVSGEPRNRDLRVPTEFTHEEIAQMIGSSRETVTRLLSDLKRKDLIRLEKGTLVIPSRIALQAIAA